MSELLRLLFAMATATPKPRSQPAALPTSRYTHHSSVIKAMRPTGEASNPYLAMSFAVSFYRPSVIRQCLSARHVCRLANVNRLCGAASQSFWLRGSWQCNRHGSIPWLEASRFRLIIQVVFSGAAEPCAFRPVAMQGTHSGIWPVNTGLLWRPCGHQRARNTGQIGARGADG